MTHRSAAKTAGAPVSSIFIAILGVVLLDNPELTRWCLILMTVGAAVSIVIKALFSHQLKALGALFESADSPSDGAACEPVPGLEFAAATRAAADALHTAGLLEMQRFLSDAVDADKELKRLAMASGRDAMDLRLECAILDAVETLGAWYFSSGGGQRMVGALDESGLSEDLLNHVVTRFAGFQAPDPLQPAGVMAGIQFNDSAILEQFSRCVRADLARALRVQPLGGFWGRLVADDRNNIAFEIANAAPVLLRGFPNQPSRL